MHVALVHMRQAGTGGTERYLNQIAHYLCECGDEVTIVCRSHEEPPHPAVRFEVLHPFAFGGAMRQWTFAQAVERHVAEKRYDLVYGLGKTWTHDVVRLGGGLHETYLKRAHARTLTTLDRLTGKGLLKHRLALAAEARALAPGAYRRIVTNSEMVKRDVIARHGASPDDVTVVYNGVDLERFSPSLRQTEGAALRRELGFAREDRVLLFLGTGYGRKGLAPLLEAFARVASSDSKLRFLVVGYDSSRPQYEARAQAIAPGRVHFLGGRRDTERCYAAADLYAVPTWYDPFANTTLEALASGLPVITTEANGGSELITESVEGSVVASPSTAEELAQTLEAALRAWSDEARLAEASPAARRLAESHSKRRVAEETRAVLHRASS